MAVRGHRSQDATKHGESEEPGHRGCCAVSGIATGSPEQQDRGADPRKWRSFRGSGRRSRSAKVIVLVGLELREVVVHWMRRRLRLIGLQQEAVLHDEDVHVGGHETPVGVLRGADNRFPADIKARVDEHRAAGLPVK